MKILKKTQTQLIVEHSRSTLVAIGIGAFICALFTVIEDFPKLHRSIILVVSGLVAVVVGRYQPEFVICDFERESDRLTIAQKRLRTLLITKVTKYSLGEVIGIDVKKYKVEGSPVEQVDIVLASGERININMNEPGNNSYGEGDGKIAEEISAFLEREE